MIADWSVEAGAASPWIEAPWPDWVDLRSDPELAASLPEVRQYPELAAHLRLMNGPCFLTTKVDVFAVSREEADPEIAEAGLEATAYGLGSYLDCIPTHPHAFGTFADFEGAARDLAAQLAPVSLPLTVAEIVIRPARLYDKQTFGWTLYAVGFGATEERARAAWNGAALQVCRALAERSA